MFEVYSPDLRKFATQLDRVQHKGNCAETLKDIIQNKIDDLTISLDEHSLTHEDKRIIIEILSQAILKNNSLREISIDVKNLSPNLIEAIAAKRNIYKITLRGEFLYCLNDLQRIISIDHLTAIYIHEYSYKRETVLYREQINHVLSWMEARTNLTGLKLDFYNATDDHIERFVNLVDRGPKDGVGIDYYHDPSPRAIEALTRIAKKSDLNYLTLSFELGTECSPHSSILALRNILTGSLVPNLTIFILAEHEWGTPLKTFFIPDDIMLPVLDVIMRNTSLSSLFFHFSEHNLSISNTVADKLIETLRVKQYMRFEDGSDDSLKSYGRLIVESSSLLCWCFPCRGIESTKAETISSLSNKNKAARIAFEQLNQPHQISGVWASI